jgi:hypothetical protein
VLLAAICSRFEKLTGDKTMKMIPAIVAVGLLGTGAAFATDAPTAPTAATAAPTAKHTSLKACNKQADAKTLTGKDRSAFVKDCRAGKSS